MTRPGMRHGTTTMYTKRGCHCEPCKRAWRDYQRKWRYESRHGQTRLMTTRECRRHLLWLMRHGMSRTQVALASGVSVAIVRGVADGSHPQAKRTTVSRLMAVSCYDRPPGTMTPAREAVSMMDRLLSVGVSVGTIRDRLGVSAPSRLRREKWVRWETRERLWVGTQMAARDGLLAEEEAS